VQVKSCRPLTGQAGTVVSNGQTQGSTVPDDRQVNVGAGMH
jgi:hypothetical protein